MLLGLLISSFAATGADMSNGADNFYQSNKVTQQKVTFKNQYQMNVVGNLFDLIPFAKLTSFFKTNLK